MIRTVFFDVGGTLITPNPSVGAIYSQVAERHGIHLSADELNKKFRDAWRSHKTDDMIVDKEWWRKVVASTFDRDVSGFFEDLYLEFEKPEVWRIFPDAVPALKALRAKNIRLAIASNWDDRLPALLKTLELDSFFERKFISYEMKVAKPNPLFFQLALTEMHVDPLEAFHVGDDVHEDIEGAQAVGMRAYLIDRANKPKNSRSLVSLEELLLRL